MRFATNEEIELMGLENRPFARPTIISEEELEESAGIREWIDEQLTKRVRSAFEKEARKEGYYTVGEWLSWMEKETSVFPSGSEVETLRAANPDAWVDGENHLYLKLMYGEPNKKRPSFDLGIPQSFGPFTNKFLQWKEEMYS